MRKVKSDIIVKGLNAVHTSHTALQKKKIINKMYVTCVYYVLIYKRHYVLHLL